MINHRRCLTPMVYNLTGCVMNEIWTRLPLTSPTRNAYACSLLSKLYQPNPLQQFRGVGYPIEPTDVCTYYGVSPTATPTVTVQGNGIDAVFIEGTDGNFGQLNNLINGWTVPECNNTTTGANPWGETMANNIISAFPIVLNATRDLLIFAHSLGSIAALAMGVILKRQFPTKLIEVSTYGSPRPGIQSLQNLVGRLLPTIRFYTAADPVRWIPPHSNEVGTVSVFTPPHLMAGCNLQVQTSDPWQLDDDGTIHNTPGEPNPTNAVALSVFRWCISPQGFANAAHNIEYYKVRFANQVGSEIVPQPAIPKPTQPQPFIPSTRREREIETQALADINQAVHSGTMPDVVVNAPSLVNPSDPSYKRRKAGRIWVVTLGADIVAVGPGKRRAGSLARRLNRARTANRQLAST